MSPELTDTKNRGEEARFIVEKKEAGCLPGRKAGGAEAALPQLLDMELAPLLPKSGPEFAPGPPGWWKPPRVKESSLCWKATVAAGPAWKRAAVEWPTCRGKKPEKARNARGADVWSSSFVICEPSGVGLAAAPGESCQPFPALKVRAMGLPGGS